MYTHRKQNHEYVKLFLKLVIYTHTKLCVKKVSPNKHIVLNLNKSSRNFIMLINVIKHLLHFHVKHVFLCRFSTGVFKM